MSDLYAVLGDPALRPEGADGIAALINPQEVPVTQLNELQALQAIIATRTVCDICGRPGSPLYPDLDGQAVRGVLCSDCIAALRSFRHDPVVLTAALAYLSPDEENQADKPGEIWSVSGPLDTYPWGDR